jgi:hypothetical protein
MCLAGVNICLLAMAVPALWSRRLDRSFRACALLCVLAATALGALMSSAEVRYAYWTMPFVFVLAAHTLVDRLFNRAAGGVGR